MITRRTCLRLGLGSLCAAPLASLHTGWAAAADPEGPRPGERLFVYAEVRQVGESRSAIIEIDPASGTWRQVLDEGVPTARISPDGLRVAYPKSNPNDEADHGIWVAPLDGAGEPKKISDLVGRPFWSNDGTQLIVSGNGTLPLEVRDQFETWQINADGSGRKRLPIRETDLVVDCTADGEWLLLHARRDIPPGIEVNYVSLPVYCVRPDGTGEILVGEPGIIHWRHHFAFGGKQIIYLRPDDEDDQCNLWVVGRDGKNPHRFITERDSEGLWEGMSSPDGQRLALVFFDRSRNPDGKKNDTIRGCRVEVTDAHGKNGQRVGLPPANRYDLLGWL